MAVDAQREPPGRELHSDPASYEMVGGQEVRTSDVQELVGRRIAKAAYPADDELQLAFDDGSRVRITGHEGIGTGYLVVWFEDR